MKTPWTHLEDFFCLRLQKTLSRRLHKAKLFALASRLQKTSSRRLGQDEYIRLGHTSSRHLQEVFKTSSKRLKKRLQDIFKTSSRHLQDVLQKYLQDVFKMYYQVKLFLSTRLWEAFNMFLRHSFPNTVIYRGICLSNTTSNKFMVSIPNLNFSLYYTF